MLWLVQGEARRAPPFRIDLERRPTSVLSHVALPKDKVVITCK